MAKFRVSMTHMLCVTKTVLVHADDVEQAEQQAAHRWKKYPTNAADREAMRVTYIPLPHQTKRQVTFNTTEVTHDK